MQQNSYRVASITTRCSLTGAQCNRTFPQRPVLSLGAASAVPSATEQFHNSLYYYSVQSHRCPMPATISFYSLTARHQTTKTRGPQPWRWEGSLCFCATGNGSTVRTAFMFRIKQYKTIIQSLAIHKHFIRTSEKTHWFFVTKTSRLILPRKIMAVLWQSHRRRSIDYLGMTQSVVHILTTVLACGCEMFTLCANIKHENPTKTRSTVPVYSERLSCLSARPF